LCPVLRNLRFVCLRPAFTVTYFPVLGSFTTFKPYFGFEVSGPVANVVSESCFAGFSGLGLGRGSRGEPGSEPLLLDRSFLRNGF